MGTGPMGQPRGPAQPYSLGGWLKRLHACLSGTIFLRSRGEGVRGEAAGRAEKQKLGSVKAPLSLGSWKKPSLVLRQIWSFTEAGKRKSRLR